MVRIIFSLLMTTSLQGLAAPIVSPVFPQGPNSYYCTAYLGQKKVSEWVINCNRVAAQLEMERRYPNFETYRCI